MKKESTIKGLKIIFGYLKNYEKDLIIISILGIISAVANGSVPYFAGKIFDSILKPSKIIFYKYEIFSFFIFIFAWFIVRLIADLVDWKNRAKSESIGNSIFSDYIINGFTHLLKVPISFHKEEKMGKITNKINNSANWLSTIASDVVINLIPQFLSIIIALSISFLIKYQLALVLVIGMIIYIIILFNTVTPMAKLQKQMLKFQSDAFGDAYDAVFNVQSIKQAVAEEYEYKKLFKNFRIKLTQFWNKFVFGWQNISFYQRIVITFTQLALYFISIIYIFKGQMTLGEIVMFNGYAGMLFGPFVTLGHHWQSIQNGLGAVSSTKKIFDYPEENYYPKNAVILDDIKGEIIFEDVSFWYKKSQKKIIEELSFKVNPGETVALVGESGVGKSTLVDLVSGYYFSQKGKIMIDGHDIRNLDLKFLRGRIAVVPQEIVLFNDTIENNIKYGNFSASERKITEAARDAYAHEFIESFPKKYNQIVGERGIKLSVGQKQRVAIARAILRSPKILILDEPTSALDARSENFIKDSLEKLMKDRTTFIIAHRLSTVQKADKILVLKDGKIIEQGKHDDLIKIPDGEYKKLYELQKL